jgi:DNA-directed RNA polymerase subunit RPC12/RpoP
MCVKNCMLFLKEHKDDIKCKHCGRSRYVKVRNEDGVSVTTKVATKQLRYIPITPRLKRLFLSKETAKQMRWHKEEKHESEEPDIMSHPVDSEAWQALDYFDPEFARDPRSVRLGLSTDGFQPHSTDSHPYSCWLVLVIPYNLPPDKCLKEGFIFLTLVISGPKEPKK